MKKILIIGKRGFIGKNLNKFLKPEYDVKLISFKNALNFNQFTKYNFVINTSTTKIFSTEHGWHRTSFLSCLNGDLKWMKSIFPPAGNLFYQDGIDLT